MGEMSEMSEMRTTPQSNRSTRVTRQHCGSCAYLCNWLAAHSAYPEQPSNVHMTHPPMLRCTPEHASQYHILQSQNPSMSKQSQFFVTLVETGDVDDEASFRLQNLPEGEMQREHIIQQDNSSLSVHADLASVVHGRFTPDGPPATIVVFDFQFVGSNSRGRRFKETTIDIQFGEGDSQVGGRHDPEVSAIAPTGFYTFNPTAQNVESTVSANMDIGIGAGPAEASVGGGWERVVSSKRVKRTTLHGLKRIEGRSHGHQNTARWRISENSNEKHGIPSTLRAAILVKPRGTRFRALVGIDAKVGLTYRLRGKGVVDPVYFEEEGKREAFHAEVLGEVDLLNLSAFDLEGIKSLGPCVCSITLGSTDFL